MSERMDLDSPRSLDQMVADERRKRNGRGGSGFGRGGRRDGGKPRHSSGSGADASSSQWKHDLFANKNPSNTSGKSPNPLASRIQKPTVAETTYANGKPVAISFNSKPSTPAHVSRTNTPGAKHAPPPVSKNVASRLEGNPLFAKIHGGQGTPGAPTGPRNQQNNSFGNNNNNNRGGVVDIGAAIRGSAKGATHTNPIPTGPRSALNIRGSSGLSIKGAAGPFVIHAANFALGTTATDVKKTFAEQLGCEVRGCEILEQTANLVKMEVVFDKRDDAMRCIEKYDNRLADGNILRLSLQNGPPIANAHKTDTLDYARAREAADRERKLAAMSYQNGMMGMAPGPTLYSDDVIRKGRGFQR